MLRRMAVITERLDGGGGGEVADGEAEKRERKNIEEQKNTMEEVGTRVMKERKMDSEKVCRCAPARQQTHHCAICLR